jgi:glycerate-2-kinase
MTSSDNETGPIVDFVLKLILESVEFCKSPFIVKNKITISSERISINKIKIDINNFNNIYLIIIGKGVIGLIDYFISKIKFGNKFKLISLMPSQIVDSFKYEKEGISIYAGNHPIPRDESFQSTLKIINTVKSLQKNDLIIFYVGGGSSSLFSYPHSSLSQIEFTKIWEKLLYSKLTIQEINIFRGFIDLVKKGGFNSFTDAEIISFSISDVVGDNLSTIGSGPTVVEETIFNLSKNLIKSINLDKELEKKIKSLSKERKIKRKATHSSLLIPQTDFAKILIDMINKKSLKTELHLPAYTGSYTLICKGIIEFFSEKKKDMQNLRKNFHLWTGESVVEIQLAKKMGMGGRNQHLLLFLYKLWLEENLPKALLVTFSTDGIDGSSPYAGGWMDTGDSSINLNNLTTYLENFDSSSFLKPNNIIETGNTGINFADIILIYIF